jgi:uncharacterized protein YbbK (DUF523 family)
MSQHEKEKSQKNKRIVIVSACLLGLPTRYDGTHTLCDLQELLEVSIAIPICPEQLGGLPTPRPSASLYGGNGAEVWAGRAWVINQEGGDVTARYMRGAKAVLEIARIVGTTTAILKARSPSCGCGSTTVNDHLSEGDGVTTALLRQHHFKLISAG